MSKSNTHAGNYTCVWITLYDPVWVEDEWHFSDIITSE